MFHRDSFKPSDLIVVKRAAASTLLPLGAFVRLNSGGPLGIVTALNQDDQTTVQWLTVPPLTSTLPDVCLSAVCGRAAKEDRQGKPEKSS